MTADSTDWRKLNRRRGANEDWREVFYLVYRRHRFEAFTLLDVLENAEKFGIRIEKESLRVKLARYVKDGILVKVDRGRYSLSSKSDEYFQLRKSSINQLFREEKEDDMTKI